MTASTPAVVSIVYTPRTVERSPKDYYARVPLEQATLVKNYGIENDVKGGHPQRQINVMVAEKLAELSAQGFKTGPGQLGEQMVISGIDLENLPAGTRLRLGDGAELEVVKARTGCDRFEHIQGLPKEQAAQHLGVLVTVVSGGSVRVGDAVRVVERQEAHV